MENLDLLQLNHHLILRSRLPELCTDAHLVVQNVTLIELEISHNLDLANVLILRELPTISFYWIQRLILRR
jgi:hypothetical protein